jgi:hypothetical protein
MGTRFIGFVLGAVTVSAQACATSQNLPGQNVDVTFDTNFARPSVDQIFKLANWAIDMRLKFAIHEGVYVGGLAEQTEKAPRALATERAEGIKQMLVQFGLTKAPFAVHSATYIPFDAQDRKENGRRVEIELSPGCPNNCCD